MMRKNDLGLTTLEWLLIVAAVAGLAALAVVLVQNVVDETAEQIAGNNARLTAAQVAAKAITDDDDKDDDKRSACNRLSVTYSGAFGGDPKRTSLWTDSNKGDDTGGVCAIVTQGVADAVGEKMDAYCTKVDDDTKKSVVEYSVGDRGGRTFTWIDTDPSGSTANACVMS